MIAVDTNILVYAHREELPRHTRAVTRLTELAEGRAPWAIPVFCIGEFVRVVTHPKVFEPPSPLAKATSAIKNLLASPTLQLLTPGPDYPGYLLECIHEGDARGNLTFDAQIVAVCREYGCHTLLTLDRDFARFKNFKTLSID